MNREIIAAGDELEELGFDVTFQYAGTRIQAFPEAGPLDRDSNQGSEGH